MRSIRIRKSGIIKGSKKIREEDKEKIKEKEDKGKIKEKEDKGKIKEEETRKREETSPT